MTDAGSPDPEAASAGVPVPLGRARPTPRILGYAAVGLAALIGGLAAGRPELAALAAPMLALVVIGLAGGDTPEVRVRADLSADRVVEGDEVLLTVSVTGVRPLPHVDVRASIPPPLAVLPPGAPDAAALLALPSQTATFRVACQRWGAYDLGRLSVRVWGRLHLTSTEGRVAVPGLGLRVLPRLDTLRQIVAPVSTRAVSGNQVSPRTGEGLEFADIRPFRPGDPARAVNWRITARRGELWVNEQYLERATDVVLFLDLFERAWDTSGPDTLDRSVRAAARLAAAYLARRDRVGVISLGGYLAWVQPGTGMTSLYRTMDVLLSSAIVPTAAWKDVRSLPIRGLPPRALVLGITPLLDDRAIQVLFDLRRRGWDVGLIDVSPVGYTTTGAGKGRRGRVADLTRRLWVIERRRLHAQYAAAGITVVSWERTASVDVAVEELELARRAARRGARALA